MKSSKATATVIHTYDQHEIKTRRYPLIHLLPMMKMTMAAVTVTVVAVLSTTTQFSSAQYIQAFFFLFERWYSLIIWFSKSLITYKDPHCWQPRAISIHHYLFTHWSKWICIYVYVCIFLLNALNLFSISIFTPHQRCLQAFDAIAHHIKWSRV